MKKFRFYTLEELTNKYPDDLYISAKYIEHTKFDETLHIDQFGCIVDGWSTKNKLDWRGEEVVEKPENGKWTDHQGDSFYLELSNPTKGPVTLYSPYGMYASLEQVKEIRDSLTDIINYLDKKEIT